MHYSLLGALALYLVTTHGAESSSPLFFFSSTASLDLPFVPEHAQRDDIHHALWSGLSTCPTAHYAVIIQPSSPSHPSDFSHSFLPIGASSRTALISSNIAGTIDVTAVVNTILMDCLHHGVLKVAELDAQDLKPQDLDDQKVSESVIFARLPRIAGHGQERQAEVARRHEYVEGLVERYFGNEDFTLIYITEPVAESESPAQEMEEVEEGDAVVVGGGGAAEVPLVFDEN